jgi:uncharacterized membrane protein HdeD (DUF308 family)
MPVLMKLGTAIMAVSGVIGMLFGLVGIWTPYPRDIVIMQAFVTSIWVMVVGFAVFVVGYCIDITH